jgi:hypothetical protein
MALFCSRIFGDVVVATDGAYVTREVSLGSHSITRSLFLGMDLDQALLDRAASLVDTLETLDARAREAIEANADDVPGYVAFHLEELDDGVLREIFHADRSTISRTAFLARLDLVGVGVHARPPDAFSLVLDYSVGRSFTDQILAVRFDTEGRAVAVSHES